jgi:drug/metabolite transporter superfamily protein YnfA
VDGYRPLPTDLIGASVCLAGVGIIVVGARGG